MFEGKAQIEGGFFDSLYKFVVSFFQLGLSKASKLKTNAYLSWLEAFELRL